MEFSSDHQFTPRRSDVLELLAREDVTDEAAIVDESNELRLTSEGNVYTGDEVVSAAFDWFRENGFPYEKMPRFVMLQQVNRLARLPDDVLQHTTEANRIADCFHAHRYHATVLGKISPFEAFMDDAKLRHALALEYAKNQIPPRFFGALKIARGTQCCSNFRPGYALYIYRRFCRRGDETVLDTSTGYGGRLVGFAASKLTGKYIGIDPCCATHDGNMRLAEALNVRAMLHNAAAEDLDPDLLKNRCDFAFTSPPYFSKEHYSDERTQSWIRYGHSFEAWVHGFLYPMMLLTYRSLKAGAFAVVNVEDVTINNDTYPLVEQTRRCARQCGFRSGTDLLFDLVPRYGMSQDVDVASERVLVFQKP